jgi:hypothetical protein
MSIDTEEWPRWPKHKARSAKREGSMVKEKLLRSAWSAMAAALICGLFLTHIAVSRAAKQRTPAVGTGTIVTQWAATRVVER